MSSGQVEEYLSVVGITTVESSYTTIVNYTKKLECGPMTNVMAALGI